MASNAPNTTTDSEVLERRRIRNREAQRRYRNKKTLQQSGLWAESLDLQAFAFPPDRPSREPARPAESLISPVSYSSSAIGGSSSSGSGSGSGTASSSSSSASSSAVPASLSRDSEQLAADHADLSGTSFDHASLVDPGPGDSSMWDANGWSDTTPVRCCFSDNQNPNNTPGDSPPWLVSFQEAAAKTRFGLDGRVLPPIPVHDPSSSSGSPPEAAAAASSSSASPGGGWLRPLHIAARKGNDRIVRILLEHGGTDGNECDSEGLTPMMHAVIGGHEDVVASLLAHSARVVVGVGDPADDHGHDPPATTTTSALHLAVVHRREALLRLLLAHCAARDISVDCYDENGKTPLHVAIDTEFEAGVVALLAHGADPQRKAPRSLD